jgi:DNA-binding transcriptional ArsR family regulator
MRNWSFITNHSVVLMYVGRHAESTVREISLAVGLSDRGVSSILMDFEECGLVTKRRVGRKNHRTVDLAAVFRRPALQGRTLGELAVWLADIYNERRDGPP